jgi:anti-sigma B factor antagonist
MEINEIVKGNYTLLNVNGRLDSTTATDFEKSLMNLIDLQKENVVCFKELKYISSSGLRVLLVAAKKLSTTGRKLTITAMQDHIKEVFDISGFTGLFNIVPENPYE